MLTNSSKSQEGIDKELIIQNLKYISDNLET